MSRGTRGVGFGVALLLTAVAAAAQGPAIEFSAEAVQMAPDKQLRTSRMYAGHERVRMEYTLNGQQVVEIVDWGRGRAVLLMPEQKFYMESGADGNAQIVAHRRRDDSNPCLGVPDLECRFLGREILSGRRVDKWEMLAVRDGKTERSLHWIDPLRQMPLRHFWTDGSISELRPLGQETRNGRAVERWQQYITRPDGETVGVSQWYDPELQIAIREELPGGFYRELRDILVAVQPAQLFEIPAGYRRIERPDRTYSSADGTPSTAPALR